MTTLVASILKGVIVFGLRPLVKIGLPLVGIVYILRLVKVGQLFSV
ncbi:hypothetical protein Q5H92_21780 [Hymenobacter sp. M29]|uniref:Uncharacterized protein n=1 Tax=Hymenobacter mellowenesis TaxID=3063995 RepID=A0ABT9AGL2_9BACT|nr:hypothetical protein [Hymenobacter sp. M29]MDO7849010.1 hypothetical protein [Hymenobacter sp. M29]